MTTEMMRKQMRLGFVRNPWDWSASKLGEVLANIGGRAVVCSISGGKDSTATALLLKHLGIPFEAVHMDTGWEDPQTDRYVREVVPEVIGQPVRILQRLPVWPDHWSPERVAFIEAQAEAFERRLGRTEPSPMVRWILKKGSFTSRKGRWCTQELKVFAFQEEYLPRYGTQFVNATGVRARESAKRSKLPDMDMDDKGYLVWRPLLDWTYEDVIEWHHRHGIQPNPLYLQGTNRVGCYPCTMANKLDGRHVSARAPERIAVIRDIEALVTTLARERAEAKGVDFTRPDGTPKFRAFFMNPRYRSERRRLMREYGYEGRWEAWGDHEGRAWVKARLRSQVPIDEFVAWASTDRRGDHEALEDVEAFESGCTRWGFCDLSWQQGGEE